MFKDLLLDTISDLNNFKSLSKDKIFYMCVQKRLLQELKAYNYMLDEQTHFLLKKDEIKLQGIIKNVRYN